MVLWGVLRQGVPREIGVDAVGEGINERLDGLVAGGTGRGILMGAGWGEGRRGRRGEERGGGGGEGRRGEERGGEGRRGEGRRGEGRRGEERRGEERRGEGGEGGGRRGMDGRRREGVGERVVVEREEQRENNWQSIAPMTKSHKSSGRMTMSLDRTV